MITNYLTIDPYKKFLSIFLLSFLTFGNSYTQTKYKSIHSGVVLFDQNNKEVNAHGACIVKEDGKFYLFGEYKSDTANCFTGFSCYSSVDLMNWMFEKIVLPLQSDGLLGPGRIGERVKVMKCPETSEFVMYMHTDNLLYKDPTIGYATCKTINGDYKFQGALLHGASTIRKWDMGTFQDTDGKGYLLIHHGTIYELASDYKSINRMVITKQAGGESPAMFRSKGVYYWLSSGLTSWERNDNTYLTATSLEGPWTPKGLFAPKGTLTWNSQCSFVLPIMSAEDTMFFYMGDRWSFPKQGSSATYVWQPLTLKNGGMAIPEFQESWRIDFDKAKWSPVANHNKSIKDKARIKSGVWKLENNRYLAREKGAIIKFSFNGGKAGIKAIADSASGYAKISITNSKGEEILSTITDFYCKYSTSSLRFLSPLMPKSKYTMTIEVLGEYSKWSDKRLTRFGSTDSFVKIEDVFVVTK